MDKCLPFGASISCSHFQHFSNALCHLIEWKTSSQGLITNYLDDFLFLALMVLRCNYLIRRFLQLCEELGIPVSLEKTEWAAEIVIFLGILLNGKDFTFGVPIEKQERAMGMLKYMLDQKKVTVKELQALCGYLNFLCRAVFPGRAFVRRMYAKYSHITNVHCNDDARRLGKFPKLKQHHHIHLDREFKADCQVWIRFLSGDLQKVVCRPMVDLLGSVSEEITFYSDSSTAKHLGFGCLLNNRWIQGFWNQGFPDFIQTQDPSIEYLELYAVVAGIFTWQDHEQLVNARITIFCDNQSVVHMINNITSSCKHCMKLIRLMTLNGLKYNRRVSAKFVDTKSNFLADALSRGQWKRFRTLGPHMNQFPDQISQEVWPIIKVWNTEF